MKHAFWSLFVVVAGWGTCQARVVPGTFELEVYAGRYDPRPERIDSDATFGIRVGRNFTKRFNVQGEIGRASLSGVFAGDLSGTPVVASGETRRAESAA